MKWLYTLLPLAMLTTPVQADLADLLNEVRADAQAETQRNQQREQRFRNSLSEQTQLLNQAQATVTRLETERDSLKTQFDENEAVLTQLTEVLQQRTGNLGELFGVFRQTATDAQSLMYNSLVSLERPDRQAVIDTLAGRSEVPTIQQMTQLWELLLDEIVYSGTVSKFNADVVEPSGEHYTTEVVRVGTFNVVTDGTYLNYLPENNQLVEFSRQPGGDPRGTAAAIVNTEADAVPFALDPSRGVLLGLIVQAPSLIERINQGKVVGYAIIGVLVIGMMLVLYRWFHLNRIYRGINRQLANMNNFSEDNPLGRALGAYYNYRDLPVDVVARKLDEVIVKDIAEIRKGLPIIKVLAAVAPLMGLLGTVTGMIGTFQAITVFGTSDPKLMAGGISQALVTTVLGLVAAIPLLLSHSLLSARAATIVKILSGQSAGMIATQAEQLARGQSGTAPPASSDSPIGTPALGTS